MKKIMIISILLFTFASFAKCQDLLIRYDFVNRNIYYFKIKKHNGNQKLIPLKNPRIGANKTIKIEYININPFIWNQPRLNLVAVAQDSISSFNPFTMMLPSSISEKFGPLSMGGTRSAIVGEQQLICESALHSLYDAYDDINTLKYNYKLTKQEILDQSRMKIRNVIKTCYSSAHMDTSIRDFKKTDFELLKSYFNDICQIDIPNATRSADNSKINSFLGKTDITSNYQELMPKEALTNIEQNYYNVSSADFAFENSFIVSDKDVILHMGFTLTDEYKKKSARDSATAEKTTKHAQTVKDESIFIPVSGGVQFSSSAGIGFTWLGPSRKAYYLENDSILASSVDNRIVPIVGSFLNAYSRRLGAVNVGGSFGLSVALQETLSINYMFGLTTVFGRKKTLLCTAGLVLAPVSEPSKGYYVGKHTTNPDFPTKLNYRPGIFFFVHYNIGKF